MGISSGSNYHSVGLENAVTAIKNASEQAFFQAKIITQDVKIAYIGLAGAGRQTDRQILLPEIINLAIAQKVLLHHDAFIALAGATICQPGVIVIAGTGAMAFGVNQSGKEYRSSGWGNILGDEGSAYYISRKALSAACKAFDGRGKKTALLESIMSYLKIDDFTEIVKKIYTERSSTQDIASIAPIVSQQARSGDEVAIEIIKDASFELALSANSVIKKLNMENEKVLVAISGSVFNAGELLLKNFNEYIKSAYPLAEIIHPAFKPVTGALLLAFREIGIYSNDIIDNLRKSG
jgi:N-acetylglucosamine kinase-like BadF-type ATPase